MLSRADLMDDAATYQRTPLGQRALLRAAGGRSTPALRFLARVNGYTDLRSLIELAPDEAPSLVAAIEQLVRDGLIERATDEAIAGTWR